MDKFPEDRMTVGQLREYLSDIEDDRVVVLGSCGDDQYYHLASDFWLGMYDDGVVGLEHLRHEDKVAGFTRTDVLRSGHRALFLVALE